MELRRGLIETVWGYAITCHKAQGSQWENVVVYDDGFGRTAEDRARWLYTAITRAECGLVILSEATRCIKASVDPRSPEEQEASLQRLRPSPWRIGRRGAPDRGCPARYPDRTVSRRLLRPGSWRVLRSRAGSVDRPRPRPSRARLRIHGDPQRPELLHRRDPVDGVPMSAVVIDFNDVMPARSQPAALRPRRDRARLRATAETWVPRLFPNGRRVGDEWRLANIHGDAPRKSGSCVITLKGEHAGDWIDFDGGQGGGPLSAIEEATGLTGRELFADAAEMVGWSPGRTDPPGATDAGRSPSATRRGDRLHPAHATPADRHARPSATSTARPGRPRRRRPARPPGPDPLGDQVRLPRADRRCARS